MLTFFKYENIFGIPKLFLESMNIFWFCHEHFLNLSTFFGLTNLYWFHEYFLNLWTFIEFAKTSFKFAFHVSRLWKYVVMYKELRSMLCLVFALTLWTPYKWGDEDEEEEKQDPTCQCAQGHQPPLPLQSWTTSW